MQIEREGPLCWGQYLPWWLPAMPGRPVGGAIICEVEVPEPLDVADIRSNLQRLCARHEILRTVYVIAENGESRQVVYAVAQVTVPVYRVEDELSTASLSRTAESLLSDESFAAENELPMRAAIASTPRGKLWLFVGVNHAAIDGGAMRILVGELELLLNAAAKNIEIDLPNADWHPIDQANFERGKIGQMINRRALDYWQKIYFDFPPNPFPIEHHRARNGAGKSIVYLRSSGLLRIMYRLAERFGVSRPP